MTPGPPTRLLVVCTANRARSPVAAQLLRREGERRGLEQLAVHDAGTAAVPGEPLLPTVARAIRDWGLELDQHRSRPLELPAADQVDLVLTMSEQQRREVVRRDPRLLDRTFTVPELIRLGSSRSWRSGWEGTDDVVRRLHRLRPVVPPARKPEDVADPAQGGRRLAGGVVRELRTSTTRIAQLVWGDQARTDSR